MNDTILPMPVLTRVLPEWIDLYGHMNVAFYLRAFDMATDVLWPKLHLDDDFRARDLGTFVAESWIAYRREVKEGDPLSVTSEVLAYDNKRLLVRHHLFHAVEGWKSAECEFLFLCVNLNLRKVATWPDGILDAFRMALQLDAPVGRLALKPPR